jgi:3',5'-cyclic AMP phosphodiesterase CpdA
MALQSLDILHLSDIHAGNGELVDEDGKSSVPKAERIKQLGRLSTYITSLSVKPNYVVVSGDITIKGQLDGMEIFRAWLYNHIATDHLPEPSKIIIVPGNHDVARRTRVEQPDVERFRNFWNEFGTSFPHATIPDLDPPVDLSALLSTADPSGVVGGIKIITKHGRQSLAHSYPFLFDPEQRLFIFAFNSAHACGVPLAPDSEILTALQALQRLQPSSSTAGQLIGDVTARYLDSLIIDAGLITDEQLRIFARCVAFLRKKYTETFDTSTKIAVLHHHIGHLWKQQLELKTFEATIDASQLKQALIETSFDVVLHGHKHTNHVGIEGGLIPVSSNSRFSPLCVISSGTVGGYPRLNDHQSFVLLHLKGGDARRTEMVITEVPIRDTASPREAMIDEAKKYNAPLTPRIPNLHDLKEVKVLVDQFVVQGCAQELSKSTGVSSRRASPGVKHKSLFSPVIRYECYGMLVDGDVRTFYEVILATEKLGFRTISRLHWLVTEVLSGARVKQRIVVIIGNLEGTHYSEAIEPGEIGESIARLREFLAPAVKSGSVEIRECIVKQSDINAINKHM